MKGKIIHVLAEQSGEGRNGPWRKREYVVEIPSNYPRKVCFEVWNNNIDGFAINEGDELTVHFDLDSREYQGRWYTSVKAWKIDRVQSGPPIDGPPPNDAPWPSPEQLSSNTPSANPPEEVDDLPF